MVDVEDKSFTVPMMKREQALRGLGTCKSTARETAARWTQTVRAGKDPTAKKVAPKPAAAEGEDKRNPEDSEYVKGALTCHDYVR